MQYTSGRCHLLPAFPPAAPLARRVLYGQMHVCSYDWAQPELGPDAPLPRRARVVLDATLSAGDQPAILFPSAGGNIHEFTALTDCAVLDLMSPPYSTGTCVLSLPRALLEAKQLCVPTSLGSGPSHVPAARALQRSTASLPSGAGGQSAAGCRCLAARHCARSHPELTCCHPAAAQPCAADEGRDCTYYAVVGEEGRQGQAAHEAGVLLDSFEPPADFVISECCWAGWQGGCASQRALGECAQASGAMKLYCTPALLPAGLPCGCCRAALRLLPCSVHHPNRRAAPATLAPSADQGHYRGLQPRPKLLPFFQGSSPTRAGGRDLSPAEARAAAVKAAAAAAAAASAAPPMLVTTGVPAIPQPSPPGSLSPLGSPPISSPVSEVTGVPKFGSLLDSGSGLDGSVGHAVADCAASGGLRAHPAAGWHAAC